MPTTNNHFDNQISKINEILADIELLRKNSVKPCIFWWLIISLPPVLIGRLYFDFGIPATLVCAVCFIPPTFIMVSSHYRSKLTEIYKNEVVPKLVDAICHDMNSKCNADFKYFRGAELDVENFRHIPFFEKKDNVGCTEDDHIIGKIGQADFQFCEARYYYEEPGKDANTTSTLFDGFFLRANFAKGVSGNTTVTTIYLDNPKDQSLKEVKYEGSQFSEMFKVFSTDEAESRDLLSNQFQESLVKLMDPVKAIAGTRNLMLYFSNGSMSLFVPSSIDHFEAKLFSELKTEQIRAEFQFICEMLLLVVEIDRNIHNMN